MIGSKAESKVEGVALKWLNQSVSVIMPLESFENPLAKWRPWKSGRLRKENSECEPPGSKGARRVAAQKKRKEKKKNDAPQQLKANDSSRRTVKNSFPIGEIRDPKLRPRPDWILFLVREKKKQLTDGKRKSSKKKPSPTRSSLDERSVNGQQKPGKIQ